MQKHMNEIYFSRLLGQRIFDSAGKMVGRVKDIAVRWDGGIPQVTGIRHTGDMDKLISADLVGEWNDTGIRLIYAAEQITATDITQEELYVGKWLLDKQIIDLKGSKLVRVNDILLSCDEQDGR